MVIETYVRLGYLQRYNENKADGKKARKSNVEKDIKKKKGKPPRKNRYVHIRAHHSFLHSFRGFCC
jgi:hypothetical protein